MRKILQRYLSMIFTGLTIAHAGGAYSSELRVLSVFDSMTEARNGFNDLATDSFTSEFTRTMMGPDFFTALTNLNQSLTAFEGDANLLKDNVRKSLDIFNALYVQIDFPSVGDLAEYTNALANLRRAYIVLDGLQETRIIVRGDFQNGYLIHVNEIRVAEFASHECKSRGLLNCIDVDPTACGG